MTANIDADLDLCQGHAMCELEAPDIFHVPNDKVTIRQRQPDESRLDAVRRAVRYCPSQALRLTDSE
jgi:ferredoxin